MFERGLYAATGCADPRTNDLRERCSDPDENSNTAPHPNPDSKPQQDSYSNPDPDENSNTDPHTNTDSKPQQDSYSNPDPDENSNTNTVGFSVKT